MLVTLTSKVNYILNEFGLYLLLNGLFLAVFLLILINIRKLKLKTKYKFATLSFAFTLLLFVSTFSTFEAYFRFVYDVPDGLGFLQVNRKWHERHVTRNNYQLRDDQFETEKKEGTVRIAVVGDSIAFGGGIENPNDRFSDILEKKLADSGLKVEVFNLGVPGTDTVNQTDSYKKFDHLKFDIVVWEYFLNDIQPSKSTGTQIIGEQRQTGKTVNMLSQKSYFFDFIYWRLSGKYNSTFLKLKDADLELYSNEVELTRHKKDIESMLAYFKEKNQKAVVIIFPMIYALGDTYPSSIHEMLRSEFEAGGATVVDLLPDLNNQKPTVLMASKFDSHPNELVHRIAAEKLFAAVKTSIENND